MSVEKKVKIFYRKLYFDISYRLKINSNGKRNICSLFVVFTFRLQDTHTYHSKENTKYSERFLVHLQQFISSDLSEQSGNVSQTTNADTISPLKHTK